MSPALSPLLKRVFLPLFLGVGLPLLLLGFLSLLSSPVEAASSQPSSGTLASAKQARRHTAVLQTGNLHYLQPTAPEQPVPSTNERQLPRAAGTGALGEEQLLAPTATCEIYTGFTTYTDLQTAIDAASSGATIKIHGTCSDLSTRAGLTQVGYISKSLTLIGGYNSSFTEPPSPTSNPSILNAQSAGRVLYISGSSSVNVSIQGLTLTGGSAGSNNGGAILATGGAQVSLTDSTLTANSAANGGGIHSTGGTLTISSSTLTSNSATSGGGGLYADGSSVTISGSTLSSNSAVNGGALYTSGGSLTLNSSSSLTSNSATTSGGALYAQSSSSLTLSSNTLTGNSAASGGALYLTSSTLTLSGGSLSTNSATGSSGNGGAIYASSSTLSLSSSTLSTNSASNGSGGALYTSGGSATLSGLTLQSNIAKTGGGALYSTGSSLTLASNNITLNSVSAGKGGALYLNGGSASLTGDTLTSNSASSDGGALYASSSALVVNTGSSFSENSSSAGNGGALYLTGGTATLSGATLYLNTASGSGGGLYSTASVTLTNTSLTQNEATTGSGGAAYLDATAASISGSTITQNSAETEGGGLYSTADTLTLSSSSVTVNSSNSGLGGGLYLGGSGSATLSSSTIDSNSTITHGAGIYAINPVLTITGGTLSSNQASSGNGGALYAKSNSVTLSGMTVSSNKARQGAGLYLTDVASQLSDNTFSSNATTGGGGGALYLAGGDAALSDNTIQQNSSYAGPGGGMHITGTTTSMLSNLITENKTSFTYYEIQTGYLTETQVITYTDPHTYVYPGPIMETKVISDNGGGLYFVHATGAFTNNIFTENEATANGGGLYLEKSEVQFWNTLIAQNQIYVGSFVTDTATLFGGSGAYIASSKAEFYHSTIADNTNLHGTTVLTDSTGLFISMRGTSTASTVKASNNIFANQDIGLYAGSDTPQIVGSSNLWWNNSERDWSRDLFDDFAIHYFGDPKFADTTAGDYRIDSDSAAFGIGVDIEGPSTDLDGQPRLRGFQPDAGAYEQRYAKGLYITQQAASDIIAEGMTFDYTVRIVNHSSAPVTSVSFNDTLPAPLALVSVSSSGGSASCTSLPCSLGTIQADELVTIVLTVNVAGAPPVGQIQELVNQATLSSPDITAGSSDTASSYSTFLQEVVLGTAQLRQRSSASEATTVLHTGGCRIHLNGTDYSTLTAALNDSKEDTDVVKVSGNCALNSTTVKYKVTIQGGWSTDMTVLDPTLYPTTLQAVGGRHFVIQGEIEPTIENFKLTGGSAASGGAVLFNGAGGTLRNLHITGNSATSKGGGIYIGPNSVPTIEQSLIENNSANSGGGGVAFVDSGATLKDSIVQNNSGPSDGGGLYLQGSGATLMRVTVKGHSVSGDGGGIYLNESPAQIMGGSITNNSAGRGGAIFAEKSAATVADNLIQSNSASKSIKTLYLFYVLTGSGGGGGIYAEDSGIRILRNRILNNSAPNGGGVFLWSAPTAAQIEGNVIAGNSGGGIFIRQLEPVFKFYIIVPPLLLPDFSKNPLAPLDLPASPISIRHNTIVRNSGDGLWVVGRASVSLVNNIIASNTGKGVQLTTESIPHLYFLVIPGFGFLIPIVIPIPTFYAPKATVDHTLWGPGGKSASASESVFGDLSTSNDLTGHLAFKPDGYHIKRISTAYAAGANPDISLDIDVEERIQGGTVDIGADEYTFRDTLYVTPSGNDSEADVRKRCRNWKTPCSLQQALEAASQGSLLKLAGGTYSQVYAQEGQSQVAYVDKTITIQGGYYVAESSQYDDTLGGTANKKDWEYPYPAENPSILNAGGTGRALYIVGEVQPEIFGVHLVGGDASAAGMNGFGGGAYVISATATISNVQVYNNEAQSGGGIYLNGSPSVIQNSLIKSNSATHGAGIYVHASDATLRQNKLESNSATDGGAIYLTTGKIAVMTNTLSINAATQNGGGVYLSRSDEATLQGNTFSTNTAVQGGGGLYAYTSTGKINFNTLTGNIAAEGGAFYFENGGDQLKQNTVSANKATTNGGAYFLNAAKSLIISDTVSGNSAPTGGAFYLLNAEPSGINGVTIESNSATGDGGGAYLQASSAAFAGSRFINNQAGLSGGALHVTANSSVSFVSSTLSNNKAAQDGGALYVKLSAASLENSQVMTNTGRSGAGIYMKLGSGVIGQSTISGNSATALGGGIYLEESATEVAGSRILGNSAQAGAGLYIWNSNSALLGSSTIQNNVASGSGGGVIISGSNIVLKGNDIRANRAGVSGGGLYVTASAISLEQSVVRENQAATNGGGILLLNQSNSSLSNVAVVDNNATNLGSGLLISGSSPQLIHTTFARNSGGNGTGIQVMGDGLKDSTVSVLNSILVYQTIGINVTDGSSASLEATFWGLDDSANQQNWAGAGTIVTGTRHILGDVLFDVDGYHLTAESAAIDEAGMPALVAKDVDGEDRPRGDAPDLGADEFVPRTCFAQVSSNPTVSYNTVQAAVDAANDGDTVKVAGTCLGVQLRNGLRQSVYLSKNITIRGGYSSTDWETSYPITQTTTIGAGSMGRIFYITGNIAPIIENLRLSGGGASGLGGGPLGGDAGGAVYINGARPIFRNNDILSSNAKFGGGFYLTASTATLSNNNIINNNADHGGGLYLDNSNALVDGNSFQKNGATNGAAIYIVSSQSALVSNNSLTENAATYGGAFFLNKSTATVEGNEVLTNTARSGGAFYLDLSEATLVGNMIASNVANLENGGGIYLGSSNATLDNNIIQENSAVNVGGGIYLNGSAATISRSTVFSNTATNGGGIYLDVSNSTLVNNFITHNQSKTSGSGLYLVGSVVTIQHNTFAGNSGGDSSALYLTSGTTQASQVSMINSIVANQEVGVALADNNSIESKATLWYNVVNKTLGAGTLTTSVADVVGNPAFVNAAKYNYHILKTSAGLDKGITAPVTLDVDGQPRPGGAGYDVGADEYYQPEITLGASGTPNPVVAGSQLTYQYRVNNTGNIDLNGIVTASLPSDVTPSGVVTWTNVSIPQGSSWTQTVIVAVPSGFAGALPTTMRVTMQEGAQGTHTYTATAQLPTPGVEATVLAPSGAVQAGSTIRYTAFVRNTGNIALQARITNTLPSQVSPSTLTSWVATIQPGGSWLQAYDVTVNANASGTLTNRLEVTTVEGVSASAVATNLVAAPAMLIHSEASGDPVTAGQPLVYGLTITNTGNITLTAAITDNLPTNVTPNTPQVWAESIPPNAVWTQEIAVTVRPGYSGLLTNTLQVTTKEGATGTHSTVIRAQLPKPGPTIQSVKSGDWDDAATWNENRVPNASDVVLVNNGHTLDSTCLFTVQGLDNQGVILCSSDASLLTVTVALYNSGEILGPDGADATADSPAEPGGTIEVHADTISNTGTIRAGNGGDGLGIQAGGAGGAIIVVVPEGALLNSADALVLAGNGGASPAGVGGPGGAVTIEGDNGAVDNQGTIKAGDGGAGGSTAEGTSAGGAGGPVSLEGAGLTVDNEGTIEGGKGGNGDQGGGPGGAIAMDMPSGGVANAATIKAGDAGDSAKDACTIGAGGDVLIKGDKANLLNEATGLIQAGNGCDGATDGGDGGAATLLGQTVTNDGAVRGGDGGDGLAAGAAGNGGDVALIAGHSGAGKADVSGEATAGAGGNGPTGGDGGDVAILGTPAMTVDNAKIAAGAGGNNADDGSVTITGGEGTTALLSVVGSDTSITGGDITISAGPGATVKLNNLRSAAIAATGDVLLAVGTGGIMDLSGNSGPVISAAGQVVVAATNVTLSSGTSLQQATSSGVIPAASRTTRTAWLITSSVVGGQPGQTVTINVIAVNTGAGADAFNLTRSDEGGWGLGTLTTPVTLAGTKVRDLKLNVTIPQSAQIGDTDTVKVKITSQTDPTRQAERYPIVFVDRANSGSVPTTLYLPVTTR